MSDTDTNYETQVISKNSVRAPLSNMILEREQINPRYRPQLDKMPTIKDCSESFDSTPKDEESNSAARRNSDAEKSDLASRTKADKQDSKYYPIVPTSEEIEAPEARPNSSQDNSLSGYDFPNYEAPEARPNTELDDSELSHLMPDISFREFPCLLEDDLEECKTDRD